MLARAREAVLPALVRCPHAAERRRHRVVERGMRLFADQRHELGIVEAKRHLPEVAHLDQLAHEGHERRREIDVEPREAADRKIRLAGDAAHGGGDLDPGLDPMAAEMKHVEGGQGALQRCEAGDGLRQISGR